MNRDRGYFEALANSVAYHETADDRRLIADVTRITRAVISGAGVHWAGSQRKGTAIVGSDLDLCVASTSPVTEAARRALRERLAQALARPAAVLSHAIRLSAHGGRPKVDIAFANAAFGSRPLPDVAEFQNRPARQHAARAVKLWTRKPGMPVVSGWVVEALVVHRDAPAGSYDALTLFERVLVWLDESASPEAVESVLRPRAAPRWNPAWSNTLPGRLEQLRGQARGLRRRRGVKPWQSTDDVAVWLTG